MAFEKKLDEVYLRGVAKEAHEGDVLSLCLYERLMRDAEETKNEYRLLYLYYIRESVLNELLEDYVTELEKENLWRGICKN